LKIFDIFCEQAGTVISTVLNKKITYHSELCDPGAVDTIQEKLPSVQLLLKIPLQSAVEGEFYLLIQKKDVAVLSDLMMMGDGTAEYSEDHKDAIGELFNQVMGAFTNPLGTEWGATVTSSTIQVEEFDIDHPPFEIDEHEMILITQSIEEMSESSVILMIPRDLSGAMFEKAGPMSSAESEEMSDGIGLNVSELDDLSKVTSFPDTDDGGDVGDNFVPMSGGIGSSGQNIEMLLDVDLDVSIELGNSTLSIKRILELAPGSIVELDRMAGEPVDLMVNSKVVAKGEVVVIDENFGIRIVSLVSPEERIRSLR
jgi:flagellar motor switch protein FliN/FliY